MLKQQTVPTSLGPLTVSSLTLGELRQLDALIREERSSGGNGIGQMFKYLPIVFVSVRKVHQDVGVEQLEAGVTFDDFDRLLLAVLEVSGLRKAPAGEAVPVPV